MFASNVYLLGDQMLAEPTPSIGGHIIFLVNIPTRKIATNGMSILTNNLIKCKEKRHFTKVS